jgi:hypothetical protein
MYYVNLFVMYISCIYVCMHVCTYVHVMSMSVCAYVYMYACLCEYVKTLQRLLKLLCRYRGSGQCYVTRGATAHAQSRKFLPI